MTLSRVWPNGASSIPVDASGRPTLTSADLGSLDGNVQRAVDKTFNGDVINGELTLGAGGEISLDSDFAEFVVNQDSPTSAGGRYRCGHGDYPGLSPAANLTAFVSCAEMFSNVGGGNVLGVPWPIAAGSLHWGWYFDPGGSVYSGDVSGWAANGAAVVPLTRMHDGSSLFTLSVAFIVNAGRTVRPGRYPAINGLRLDPFLGTVTSFTSGWNYFPNAASLAAYKAGAPNTITATSTLVGPIDLSKYLYFLALLDEDYAAESDTAAPNLFSGISTNTLASDLRFQ